MKKLLSFCAACLVALSGCTPGGGESTAPPPVSPSAGLPSTTPLSSQEVVLTPSPSPDSPAPSVPASAAPPVESASPAPSPTPLPPETPVPETPVPETPVPETPVPETPAWDGNPDALTLDDFPTQLITGPELAAAAAAQDPASAGLYLVAQLPDADTWLYGFCGPQDAQGLILRVGAQWQAYDIPFLTPGAALPAMAYGDYDGDGAPELALSTLTGSGSGAAVWSLSVVDFSTDLWELLQFIPADYGAILDLSLTSAYDAAAGTVTLQAGGAVLTLSLADLGYADPGGTVEAAPLPQVSFTAEGDALSASFGVGLFAPNLPPAGLPAAALQADVVYTGSAFGLGDFTLSQPES